MGLQRQDRLHSICERVRTTGSMVQATDRLTKDTEANEMKQTQLIDAYRKIAALPIHPCDDARNQAALVIAVREARAALTLIEQSLEGSK